MEKKYEKPSLEIICFAEADIICGSGIPGDGNVGGAEWEDTP